MARVGLINRCLLYYLKTKKERKTNLDSFVQDMEMKFLSRIRNIGVIFIGHSSAEIKVG